MGAKDVVEIIQVIPQYIEYVYPGFLLMYLYQFFRGKYLQITQETIAVAICLSYVMKIMAGDIFSDAVRSNLLLIAVAFVIAYAGYRFTRSQKVIKILRWLKIYTTFAENEVDALLDSSDSAWLRVYLKDEDIVYEGSLGAKELEEGQNRFITLEAFWKYRLDENGSPIEPYIEDHTGNYEERVVISYETIKRTEKRDVPENG